MSNHRIRQYIPTTYTNCNSVNHSIIAGSNYSTNIQIITNIYPSINVQISVRSICSNTDLTWYINRRSNDISITNLSKYNLVTLCYLSTVSNGCRIIVTNICTISIITDISIMTTGSICLSSLIATGNII